MSTDWPKDPVLEEAMAAWGARCDDALAPANETLAAADAPAQPAPETAPDPPVVAIDLAARRRRRPPPLPAAVAGLCVLVMVVVAVVVVVNRPRPADDLSVGAGGQPAVPTSAPQPTLAPPPTSTLAPPGQVEVRRETATVAPPVGPDSGSFAAFCSGTQTPVMILYTLAGRPASLAAGDDGSVWFTDPVGHSIGRLEVAGALTRFVLPTDVVPRSLARGPTGDFWFTNAGISPAAALAPATPSIGRITPAGAVTFYPLPTKEANTLGGPGLGSLPTAIAAGPDGAMWFVETGADQIGRIGPDGTITEYPLPSRTSMHASPTDVVAGPDGAMWFTQPLRDSLGRIDVTTGAITEVPLPKPESGLVRGNSVTSGPAGSLWFEDPRNHAIGRVTPAGSVTAVPLADTAQPWSVTAGPDGSLWFVETWSHRIMRVTPGGDVSEFPPVHNLMAGSTSQLAVASDRAVWFSAGGANRLGRITCTD